MKKKDKPVKEKKDYGALWDKHVRLHAEFDNYKKRSLKDRADFIKFANEGLILELLSILDNFERGIKSAEQKKDYELLHQGVNMISKQLHSLLETKGLNRIQSLGQKFDPHQHEAVEVVEVEDAEDEVVAEELQPGYTLGGRILRPARVKVIKKKVIDIEQPASEKKEDAEDSAQMTDEPKEKIEDIKDNNVLKQEEKED